MRSVTLEGRGGVAAALVLVAMVAVGCGGHEASGQELPDVPGQPAAVRIADEGVLPGDQREPGSPTVTTAERRWPIGKASSPAVTTTSTAPRPITTSTSPPPATTTVGE
jgi:hypothetical protein